MKLGDKAFLWEFQRNIFDLRGLLVWFEDNEIIFDINSYEKEESVRPRLTLSLHPHALKLHRIRFTDRIRNIVAPCCAISVEIIERSR
jgi:hypothetical protein